MKKKIKIADVEGLSEILRNAIINHKIKCEDVEGLHEAFEKLVKDMNFELEAKVDKFNLLCDLALKADTRFVRSLIKERPTLDYFEKNFKRKNKSLSEVFAPFIDKISHWFNAQKYIFNDDVRIAINEVKKSNTINDKFFFQQATKTQTKNSNNL